MATAAVFLVSVFPQWIESIWALFCGDPLIPTLLSVLQREALVMDLPDISIGWLVSLPVGFVMFGLIFLELRAARRIQGRLAASGLSVADEEQRPTTAAVQQESKWVKMGGVRIQAYIGNMRHDQDTGCVRHDLLSLRIKPDRELQYLRTDLVGLTVYRSDLRKFVRDAPPFQPVKILALSGAMFPGKDTAAMLVNCGQKTRFEVADQIRKAESGRWCAALKMSQGENELGVFGVTFEWSIKAGLSSPAVTLQDLDT